MSEQLERLLGEVDQELDEMRLRPDCEGCIGPDYIDPTYMPCKTCGTTRLNYTPIPGTASAYLPRLAAVVRAMAGECEEYDRMEVYGLIGAERARVASAILAAGDRAAKKN